MNEQLSRATEVIETIAGLQDFPENGTFDELRIQYRLALAIARDGLDFLKRNKETK